MELSMRPIQAFLPAVSDASSPAMLIEYGLQCARQENWSEAGYFFQLAREQLSLTQQQFAPELDLCLRDYTGFVQAQQDLHRASKQFVHAESTLQTQLLLLEKLLPALRDDKDAEQEQPPTLTVTPLANAGAEACPCSTHMTKDCNDLPPLYIICFGGFAVRRSEQAQDRRCGQDLPLSGQYADLWRKAQGRREAPDGGKPHPPLQRYWHSERSLRLCQNRNGQAILRILVAQSGYRASADMLMDILWRNHQPAAARRKLQVAISALRCSLNSGLNCDAGTGYILCKDQYYQLNPAITIATDVAEFLALWEAGRQLEGQAAIELYEKACHLRSGPFLVEDLYADWSSLLREQLDQTYLTMCQALSDYYLKIEHYDEAVKWSNAMLKENRYDERAYRQLMHVYTAQGRRCEALRQYQLCERVLKEELGISPMPETVQLFQTLRAGEESLS
jgi:DNA-binding SARP family transcriptional activator